ncbi:hypothetical protein E2C01_061425 [Portunus trituberculatus]|uniref:Uncharacterized protein n=1 Tax=Portunus trituberculatus TaxID=210409 RepID=A0A5B7H826_PORTR|nr:hypothetical protein [Portunus trituberculatus]
MKTTSPPPPPPPPPLHVILFPPAGDHRALQCGRHLSPLAPLDSFHSHLGSCLVASIRAVAHKPVSSAPLLHHHHHHLPSFSPPLPSPSPSPLCLAVARVPLSLTLNLVTGTPTCPGPPAPTTSLDSALGDARASSPSCRLPRVISGLAQCRGEGRPCF